MNLQPLRVDSNGQYVAAGVDGHRVLRNTYALLALSMVPTVAGAWLGVATGLLNGMGLVGSLAFFGLAMVFMVAIGRKRNSPAAVPMLLAFTFFMGLMMSRLIGAVLGLHGGAGLVMTAFSGTALVFFGMAALSSVMKRDLSSMGKFLFIGMVMLVVAGLANLFIQSGALMITLSVISIGLFSAFVLHDLKRVRDGEETNYVMATLGVYLSLVNVFQSMLAILGIFGSRDE